MARFHDGQWQSLALELLRNIARGSPTPLEQCSEATLRQLEARQIDGLYYSVAQPDHPRRRLYAAIWAAQRAACVEAVEALESQSIETVVFKGADFLDRYFPAPFSIMSDVDLLVKRNDVGRAKAELYRLGYRQAAFNRARRRLDEADVAAVADTEAHHYELFPFLRLDPIRLDDDARALLRKRGRLPVVASGGELKVVIGLDVHHGVATDIATEPLMRRSRRSSFPAGRSLSPADHLWLVTARLYNETALHGKRSLRDFAYLVALLTQERIRWDDVLQSAADYEMHAALYYYFMFLSWLAPDTIPLDVLERLSPLHTKRLRDWGWQLGVLFDALDPQPFGRDLQRQ